MVVVNHHLLAADLSVRQAQDNWQEAAVLPPYQPADSRRGPPSRGCRRQSSGHPGYRPGGSPAAGTIRAKRPWPGSEPVV